MDQERFEAFRNQALERVDLIFSVEQISIFIDELRIAYETGYVDATRKVIKPEDEPLTHS